MSKKIKKIIIIISVVLVVFIAVGIGMLFLATDIFKSPQQLFYKYVGKNSKIIEILESESYSLLQEKKNIAPYTSQGEISIKQVNQDVLDDNSENIENELFRIVTDGKVDLPNKKQYANITLAQSNNNIFNMKYLRTGDKYALTSDEIVTKYVAVENNNLKELFKKFGMSDEELMNIPDKIETKDILSVLAFTEEEKELLLGKYANLLVSSIPKDKFSKSNTLDGGWEIKSYKANVYTLTITNVEMKNLAINLLTTLQNDDVTLNILLDKYNKIANNGMTLEKLKEVIGNLVNEFSNVQLEKTENISINLYISDGNLLKTEIVTTDVTLQIKYFTTEEKVVITIIPVDMELYEGSFDNIEIKKLETDSEYSLNILLNSVSVSENTDSISIQISNAGTINSNNIRQLNILRINQDGESYEIRQSNNLEFETSLEIEELKDENSETINNYTQEQLVELITALQNRISQVFMEKMVILFRENANETTNNTEGQNGITVQEIEREEQSEEETISETEQLEIDTFNEQFTPYLGEAIQGEKLKTLLQNVKIAVENGNSIKVQFSGVYNNASVEKQGVTGEEIGEMLIYVIMSKSYFVEGLADTTGRLSELTIKENT